MAGIDPAQQLALIEAEGNGVIGQPRSGLPCRFLTRQHAGETIEIGDEAAIERIVQRIQPGLVCEELPDGDSLFAPLREFRPIRAHPFVVVEPAAGMRDGERHRGEPLGGREDDYHRVLLPRFAGLLVADPAPEVDDLLASVIGAAGTAQLPAAREVVREGRSHGFKATTDVSLDRMKCGFRHGSLASRNRSLTSRAIATTTADARYCLASRPLPVEAEVGSEHVESVIAGFPAHAGRWSSSTTITRRLSEW
jgi:hypothetical protein